MVIRISIPSLAAHADEPGDQVAMGNDGPLRADLGAAEAAHAAVQVKVRGLAR